MFLPEDNKQPPCEEDDEHVIIDDYFLDDDEPGFNVEDEIPARRHDKELAIQRYIKLIRMPETDQIIREQLVAKVCALRIQLNDMNEEAEKTSHLGHTLIRFIETDSPKSVVCDSCEKKSRGLPLTSLFRSSNSGKDMLVCYSCNLHIHQDCLEKPGLRPCPRLDFDKEERFSGCNKSYEAVILKICPEIGMVKQQFKCNDCDGPISFNSCNLCDYDGKYYCQKCHSGDTAVIPARIIHNWDFLPRPVSKKSLLTINYIRSKPILFDILQLNSMLYGFVEELPIIKRMRKELISMAQYARLCRQPFKPKLTISQHLIEESLINCYTIDELCNTVKLQKDLIDVHSSLLCHITKDCESCRGKGFYCELCHDKDDLLFPFASNIASCPQCSVVYHKNCYHRKNRRCTRCKRLEEKNSKLTQESL
ncbi:differentially expressed in FDCP 8 homolog [Tetranychus urticae]|uniref:Rubicon Homology domain-containing protein n=1 Tax=Tetranychus urticae TaxID=32264 RepID=T1L0C9_TETUR|nr:differentially expressed in FDCP 8 homolog [Tetranychus urticae]